MSPLSELGGKRLPFLRWSLIRMVLGTRHLTTEWQVGDGRELALADHVEAEARRGDRGGSTPRRVASRILAGDDGDAGDAQGRKDGDHLPPGAQRNRVSIVPSAVAGAGFPSVPASLYSVELSRLRMRMYGRAGNRLRDRTAQEAAMISAVSVHRGRSPKVMPSPDRRPFGLNPAPDVQSMEGDE